MTNLYYSDKWFIGIKKILIRNEIFKIIVFFHFIIWSNIITLYLLLKENFISRVKHFDIVMIEWCLYFVNTIKIDKRIFLVISWSFFYIKIIVVRKIFTFHDLRKKNCSIIWRSRRLKYTYRELIFVPMDDWLIK